jgi:tagatose-1,6-bisphosphate aldolase non-catalytic subunit AgaZ/GatZ
MIILQESASAQIIAFIPRQDTYNGLTITDEQTGVTTNVTIVSNTVGEYYNTIEAVFTLVENHFYILKVKQGSTVVFQDKVFCTNQSIPTFSVNEGQYINNSSNNDFILYE